MIRKCDGTDENLIRDCEPGDPRELKSWKGSRPCDCGKVFDDAKYRVTYPHYPV